MAMKPFKDTKLMQKVKAEAESTDSSERVQRVVKEFLASCDKHQLDDSEVASVIAMLSVGMNAFIENALSQIKKPVDKAKALEQLRKINGFEHIMKNRYKKHGLGLQT